MKRIPLLAIAILPLLAGCTGLSKTIRELSKDPAVGSFEVMSPYANIRVKRVGPQTNNAVTVNADGAITVTPQLARPAVVPPPVPQP